MGSRRRSVFERLGPLPADAPTPPPAVAEQQAQPLPKQRVALAHPLVARHLMLAQSEKAAAAGGAPPGLQGPAALQQQHQRKQQQHRRRQRDRPHEQQRGSFAGSSAGRQHRQQRDRSRGNQSGLQDELQRLQVERDAAEEMLGQMAAQTQSLLADKAALQQQAAKLEALACALQERLDFLLLEEDSQEWDVAEGLLPDAADSERGASYGSSAAQPSTPSAAHGMHDAVTPALHSRLGALAVEQHRAAVAHTSPSSSGASGPPSSRSSPGQAGLAADVE